MRPGEAIDQQRMRFDEDYQRVQMDPKLRAAYENCQTIQTLVGVEASNTQNISAGELGTFAPQQDVPDKNKDACIVSVLQTQR